MGGPREFECLARVFHGLPGYFRAAQMIGTRMMSGGGAVCVCRKLVIFHQSVVASPDLEKVLRLPMSNHSTNPWSTDNQETGSVLNDELATKSVDPTTVDAWVPRKQVWLR